MASIFLVIENWKDTIKLSAFLFNPKRIMKRFARSFVPLLQTNKIFVPQATLYHSLPTQYSTNSIYKNFAPFVSSQRYFTDAPKPINKTKIIEILKLFKEVTENHELVKTKLNNIHNSDADQITKWQEMMKIIVPVQHKILSHYDYSMEEFKKQLEKIVEEEGKENSEIFSIYKENWLYWVEAVFGVKNVLGAEPKIPKKKMVTLIQNFVDSLTGNNFLREISDVVNSSLLFFLFIFQNGN